MDLDASRARDVVFDRMNDPVLVVDAAGRIVDRNRAAEELLAAAEDAAAGPECHVDRYPALAPVARGPIPTRGDGPTILVGERVFGSSAVAVVDGAGITQGRAIVLRDVTRQVRSEEMLRTLATTDELTRLPNRRQFLELARQVGAQAQRSRTRVSWLMFDVDGFGSVNVRHGRPLGDLVLQSVAAIASASVRAGDVVGRIGGDEFALCLPDTGPGGAEIVAQRLLTQIANLRVAAPEGDVQVTASIGGYVVADPDVDAETALVLTEKVQYRARRAGGNRVEFHVEVGGV